jgi:phosphinothricin acetyltransferase
MLTIRAMTFDDWPIVEAIYRAGIETGNATFEQKTPEWSVWDAGHHQHSRLVAMLDGQIVGWAAISPISKRAVYAGVAEESIYIAESARGRGVGKTLLAATVAESEQNGIWTLQTGIFPENVASLRLHQACGFVRLGTRKKIGQMNGIWRDVIFLERRSEIVGV